MAEKGDLAVVEKDDWVKKSEEFCLRAFTLMMKNKYSEALRWFRMSAAISEEEDPLGDSRFLPGTVYNNIAVAHYFKGEMELAMLYYRESEKCYRNTGWLEQIFDQQLAFARCWCKMGEIHATVAVLDEANRQTYLVEFPSVPVGWPGYKDMEGALVFLQESLRDHADSSDQQKADCYAVMRYIYRFTGQPEEALQMHKLCVEHGGSRIDTIGHGLMMATEDKGGAYSYLQDLLDQQDTDHHLKRDAYCSMGLLLTQQGHFQEAQEHYIKALKLALHHRCPDAAMLTYFYLGQVEHRAATHPHKKSPLSQKYYKKGRALAEKLKVCTTAADTLLRDDKLQRLRDLFQYRQELAQQDPYKIAEALVLLNNAYLSIFHNPQLILQSVKQALDLLLGMSSTSNSDVTKWLARCHSHRGLAYFRLEDMANALISFEVSIDLFENLGETDEIINLIYYCKESLNVRWGDRENLPKIKNHLERALGLLERKMDLLPSKPQITSKARAHCLLMSIAMGEDDLEEALIHFSQCNAAAEDGFDADVLIKAHIMMANVQRRLLRQYKTREMFSKDYPEGYSFDGSDTCSEKPPAEPKKGAEGDAHKVHLELARKRGSPIMLAHSLSAMGDFYRRRKKYADAQVFLEEAASLQAEILSSIEQIDASEPLKFMQITRETHFDLLSCIAAQDDLAVREEGLVWAERLRTRTLMRAMDQNNLKEDSSTELRNFDRDKQGALRTLKDLSKSCPGVLFVEYALLYTELLIWVIRSGSIILRTVPFERFDGLLVASVYQTQEFWDRPLGAREKKRKELRDSGEDIGVLSRNGIVALLKRSVQNIKEEYTRTDEYLHFLYEFLIFPIHEDLAEVTEDQCIMFIPHEDLVCVPFVALQDKYNNYLIEYFNIAVSMSMRAFAYCERRYAETKTKQRDLRDNILVVSNPFPVDSQESMGLLSSSDKLIKPLREADLEAQTISKIMQAKAKALHVCHLGGRHAHKVKVMEVLPKADWLHFACHGFVSRKYPQGALLLGRQIVGPFWLKCLVAVTAFLCRLLGAQLPSFVYKQAQGPSSVTGILGAEEVLKCGGMQARCVVLNACNSAQGKMTVDGLFNWSHILQQVGVPSVVLCHWEVEDSAGREFMCILYGHLTAMLPLGVALRETMVAMIGNEKHKHPKHWASYSLVGVPHIQLLERDLENQAGQQLSHKDNIAQGQATLGHEAASWDGIPGSSAPCPDLGATSEAEPKDSVHVSYFEILGLHCKAVPEIQEVPGKGLENEAGLLPEIHITPSGQATLGQANGNEEAEASDDEEENLYEYLGVKPGCSQAEIDAAYRKIASEMIPQMKEEGLMK